MRKSKLSTKDTKIDVALLFLRTTLGLAMLIGHGLGKWQKLFGDAEIQFADPLGIGAVPSLALAVFAEFICAVLLILGLLTRWALLPLIITMAVAVFVIHISDGFGIMEKAILYGVGFITLFITGPGRYSLDAFFKSRNKK